MSWLSTIPLPPCMVDNTCISTNLSMDFPGGPLVKTPMLAGEVKTLIHNFFMHSCLGYCRKMLKWTWKYRYLFKILFSLPLDIYPEVKLLVHMIAIYFFFSFVKNFHIIFHRNWTTLHCHRRCIRVPFSLHPH